MPFLQRIQFTEVKVALIRFQSEGTVHRYHPPKFNSYSHPLPQVQALVEALASILVLVEALVEAPPQQPFAPSVTSR